MAKQQIGFGVELEGETARLVTVARVEDEVTLVAQETVPPGGDLARAIRAHARRPLGVVAAIPMDQAAVRILSIPPTTDENLARVVAMEAETALPFPIEEQALAHHMLGMTDQSRLEVLLCAARTSAVQAVLGRLQTVPGGAGSAVTLSAAALMNALHHLRPRDTLTAVLRIESNVSELLVLDRMRVLAAQTIPIGCGAAVREAERVPVAAGTLMGEAPETPEPASWLVALSQQVRYALQALSYERGLALERLYLCGAGAAITEVDWQLGERLGMPATLLAAGADADSASYTVAYGCALQAVGSGEIALNLTPARVAVAREVEERRQARLSWGALAGSVVVAGTLMLGAAMHHQQRSIEQLEGKLGELGVVLDGQELDPGPLKAALTALEDVGEARVPASRVMTVLNRQLPESVWLRELTYTADTGATLRGYSLDQSGPQRAHLGILRQQLFDEVRLDYRHQEYAGDVPVWSFQVSCRLQTEQVGRGRR
jgi:Tfp pilus assembly PilM family ATPase/Tfp pilus assembly protein PilN